MLEGDFGVIPIEIKHTQTVRTREIQSLDTFISDFKCKFGIDINNDERPRFYTERIHDRTHPFANQGVCPRIDFHIRGVRNLFRTNQHVHAFQE